MYLENLNRKVQRHPHEHCIITDKINYSIHWMKLQFSYTVISFWFVSHPGRPLLLPLHSSYTSSFMGTAPLCKHVSHKLIHIAPFFLKGSPDLNSFLKGELTTNICLLSAFYFYIYLEFYSYRYTHTNSMYLCAHACILLKNADLRQTNMGLNTSQLGTLSSSN